MKIAYYLERTLAIIEFLIVSSGLIAFALIGILFIVMWYLI